MYIDNRSLFIFAKNQRGIDVLQNLKTMDVIAKRCTSCGGFKFIEEYNKAGKGYAGTHSYCRSCHRKRNKHHRVMKGVFH